MGQYIYVLPEWSFIDLIMLLDYQWIELSQWFCFYLIWFSQQVGKTNKTN